MDLFLSILSLIKAVFKVIWPLCALILIIYIGKAAFRLYEKQRLSKSGIDEIDNMDGRTFEKYLEVLFERLGYR